MTEDIFAQKGWICPKCGRVLAPSTMYCLWCCSDMKESITTTGTSIPKWDTTPIKTADTPQTDRMTEEEIDTMLAKVLVGQTDCQWK